MPEAVRPEEAADAGMRSIEHLHGLAYACSSVGDSLRRVRAADSGESPTVRVTRQALLVSTYDAGRCAATIAVLGRRGTWITPTLALGWGLAYPDSVLGDSARMSIVPQAVRTRWGLMAANSPGLAAANARPFFDWTQRVARQLHESGVPFLAGTDVGNPLLVPGYSLHDELRQFVRLGLTPLEALQTATINPARFFNATDSLGTVAVGKLADLVLLEADPLLDIRNTMHISVVVLDGQVVPRPRR